MMDFHFKNGDLNANIKRSLSFLRVFAFVAQPLRPAISGVETVKDDDFCV